MHLGSDAIGTECAVVTWAVAAAGLGLAAYSAIRRPQSNANLHIAGSLMAAVLTAGVFAAQMFNVPILDFSSGHLVGGVLLAWLLGPRLGACCMALVLAVQAVLLGDGSIASLGANIINMGIVPAISVTIARRALGATGSRWYQSAIAGGTALVATLVAALLIPLEVALLHDVGGWSYWLNFVGRMASIHLPIAVAEGVLTAGVAFALLPAAQSQRYMDWLRLGITTAAVGLVLAIVPWSSPQPDGYEWSAEASGLQQLLGEADAADSAEPMFSEEAMAVGGTLLVALMVAGVTLLLPSKRVAIASKRF